MLDEVVCYNRCSQQVTFFTLSETDAYGKKVWKIRVYHVYVYEGFVHH